MQRQASNGTGEESNPTLERSGSSSATGSQQRRNFSALHQLIVSGASPGQLSPAPQRTQILGRVASNEGKKGTSDPSAFVAKLSEEGQTTTKLAVSALATVTSPSSTIHHLGQSPTKVPPLVNPAHHLKYSNMSLQSQHSATALSPIVTRRQSSGTSSPATSPRAIPISPLLGGFAPVSLSNITSPMSSPARKRKRLEENPPSTPEIGAKRKLICDEKLKELMELKENYKEHLTELFFMQSGLNIMDLHSWKKKPTLGLINCWKTGSLDSDDEEFAAPATEKKINDEVKVITAGGTNPISTPVAISTTLPPAVLAIQKQGTVQGLSLEDALVKSPSSSTAAATTATGSIPSTTAPQTTMASSGAVTSTSSATKIKTGSTPITAQNLSSKQLLDMGSQEAIVERAKQEAQVMQRIAELRREGLWTARRLPRVQEPTRNKAHWDYLLEEMQWLATDFTQERKWKKAGARKIARMIQKYHQEIHQKEVRAEREQAMKLKRIAGGMAKMIKEFWNNIEKVVQFKQQSRLDEKRKKAMDLHLSFIVDQTEKYSSWLTKGLAGPGSVSGQSIPSSSVPTSPALSGHFEIQDDDFEPEHDESDDEETIEKEEKEAGPQESETAKEIDDLQKESEMPIEELLKSLPAEILEKPADIVEPATQEHEPKDKDDDSEDFGSSDEDEDDVEDTIDEQEEEHEQEVDHKEELADLAAEGDLDIEELRKKYAGAYEDDFDPNLSGSSTDTDDDDDDDGDQTNDDMTEGDEESEEEEEVDGDDDQELGFESLMETDQSTKPTSASNEAVPATQEGKAENPDKDIQDIAATALSLQPTGYTLETTQVHTKVPFLLKHSLREYQHVGLDWLATMHDRRLNGILADEMGLGKTIQTIAALAHLACEKGVWGPHLIVVPTSVMLNWEMEFKKWCPAFKILTYYGNQKERKQKRQGWTKTNAFHICITSYKLVVQDHQAFRRKKWKYFILDEAQNIKNFKSQRWQMLLNFSSQRRLLLTGTPLQNSLMELWSLMHFLMPNVFASHRDFKEWFSNPLTGMIEGSREYNEGLIKRLHKVLRPFLLRRLKADVEKQMPKKYEHVVMCHLAKRQRYLYDEFMSQTKTKETLASGHYMSVINILMQLRKVCNHPNLFDPRPTVSPFQMEGITYHAPSLVLRALEKESEGILDPALCLANLELSLSAYNAHRSRKLQTQSKLIEEMDNLEEAEPRPFQLQNAKQLVLKSLPPVRTASLGRTGMMRSGSAPVLKVLSASRSAPPSPDSAVGSVQAAIQQSSAAGAVDHMKTSSTVSSGLGGAASGATVASPQPGQQSITVQIHHTADGRSYMIPPQQISQLPAGFIQIVQTSSGHKIITTAPQSISTQSSAVNGPTTVNSTSNSTTAQVQLPTSTSVSAGKPIQRVAPLNSTSPVTNVPVAAPKMLQVKAGKDKVLEKSSDLYMSSLVEKREKWKAEKLSRMIKVNRSHCDLRPVYGKDLFRAVDILHTHVRTRSKDRGYHQGYLNTLAVKHPAVYPNHPNVYWRQTNALTDVIKTPSEVLNDMDEILKRFTFNTPLVTCPSIKMHTSHPPPSYTVNEKHLNYMLHKAITPTLTKLHPITSRMTVQFPEARLIQYDCGKLQTLDILLHRLKSGQHRVLIFTQMTRMLDVLEAFLNYHGYRYLRLDGTTRVEQRQVLMDRFNMDKRIFVFILSTRSGGIGVNLTGADTVIFYDSDWNPTMDAQAQDRCHRIGQTRDVHIYRLISEKTVEENILKKANQKRLLGDVAIEGGNFTAAFFKQNTIKELFEEPSGLSSLVEEKNKEKIEKEEAASTVPAVEVSNTLEKSSTAPSTTEKVLTEEQIEQALCQAEDESDVQAAKVVKAEQKAELAEFDETIAWDEREAEQRREQDQDVSKLEQELAMLDKELTPIERYAVGYMEIQLAPETAEELERAEDEVALVKEEWELNRLKQIKEDEEMRAELEEDEMLFTYTRDEVANQVKKKTKAAAKKAANKSLPPKASPDSPSKRASVRIANKSSPEVNTPVVKSKIKRLAKVQSPRRTSLTDKIKKKAAETITKKLVVHIPNKDQKCAVRAVKKIVGSKQTAHKSLVKATSPASSPKTPLSPGSSPKPFSNPNLVIRTRRSSAKHPVLEDVQKGTIITSTCILSPGSLSKNVQVTRSPSTSVIGSPTRVAYSQPQPILQVMAASLQASQQQARQQSVIKNKPTMTIKQAISGNSSISHLTTIPLVMSRSSSAQQQQQPTVVQTTSNPALMSRIHNTVPILEKLALQFSVPTSLGTTKTIIQQGQNVILPAVSQASSSAGQNKTQFVTKLTGNSPQTTLVRSQLSGTVRQIGKPTVAQLMAARQGLTQGLQRPMVAVQGKQGVTQLIPARIQPSAAAGLLQNSRTVLARPQGINIALAKQPGQARATLIQNKSPVQKAHIVTPRASFSQVIQKGGQIIRPTRPLVAQVVRPGMTRQMVTTVRPQAGQRIQGVPQIITQRGQQYVVVSTPDMSNPQSRIVILQPSMTSVKSSTPAVTRLVTSTSASSSTSPGTSASSTSASSTSADKTPNDLASNDDKA